MIDLSLPAMNVVGFEHTARNKKQRRQISQAADRLRDGEKLFAPSPAAKCSLLHADVESDLLGIGNDKHGHGHGHEREHGHGHEHDDHHESKHEHDHGHDDDHESEHSHDHDHENHADFEIIYEFSCAEPAKLSALTLSLFEQFPKTEYLRTQVITDKRQGGEKLTAEN